MTEDLSKVLESIDDLSNCLQELKPNIIELQQTIKTLSERIIELEEELGHKQENNKKVTFRDKLNLK